MHHRDLPVDLFFQDHAGFDQRPGIALLDGETHLADIDQRIEDAPKGDIGADGAEIRSLDRGIKADGKSWHII